MIRSIVPIVMGKSSLLIEGCVPVLHTGGSRYLPRHDGWGLGLTLQHHRLLFVVNRVFFDSLGFTD